MWGKTIFIKGILKYLLQVTLCLSTFLFFSILPKHTYHNIGKQVKIITIFCIVVGFANLYINGYALSFYYPYLHYNLIDSKLNEYGQNSYSFCLGLLLTVYLIKGIKIYSLHYLTILFFIIVSGSRSTAIISLFVTFTYLNSRFIKLNKLIYLGLITSSVTIHFAETRDFSLNERSHAFHQGIDIVENSSLFGIGTDNFQLITTGGSRSFLESRQDAHNDYLKVLVEEGIFGLLATIIVVVSCGYRKTKVGCIIQNNPTLVYVSLMCMYGDFLWQSTTWAALAITINNGRKCADFT